MLFGESILWYGKHGFCLLKTPQKRHICAYFLRKIDFIHSFKVMLSAEITVVISYQHLSHCFSHVQIRLGIFI